MSVLKHIRSSRLPRAAAWASLWLVAALLPAGAQDQRIVAAGGIVTEVLYALGAGDRIVGVDTTSVQPPSALKEKPNVGYVRQLSAEGVLSLRPGKVIAIHGAGPPEVLRLIRDAGVAVEIIPEAMTEVGAAANVRAIGAAAGLAPAAESLARDVEHRLNEVAALRARLPTRRRVMFVLALRDGRPMVAGRNSGADLIIRLAGGINAMDSIEGYKPVSDEAVVAAQPDVILMMNRAGITPDPASLFAVPAFSATPAARNARLVVMDGQYLLGFGPRTPQAAAELMASIYPELTAFKAGPGQP